MIRMELFNVGFGSDALLPHEGKGCRINFLSQESGMLITVPLPQEIIPALVKDMVRHLTEDQKRELAPLMNGGVIMPPPNFKPGGQG